MAPADRIEARSLVRLVAVCAGALMLAACTALAAASDRDALWRVVRACATDAKLTGLPFPCLSVDLKEGEQAGHVVLRPPWANDTILAPTRRIVGLEDPSLQSPEAPNYFAEAWRARGMIATANGRRPSRPQIALIANSRIVRGEDQLHIHIGCLVPAARRAVAEAAESLPPDTWRLIGPIIPHQPIYAMRVRSADLDGVEPFRLAHAAFDGSVRNPADLMIAVVGAEVAGEDEFVILASYAGLPHSWWPVGSDNLINPRCLGEAEGSGMER
jgi:CDP-diacylglycerol pyrophosphatase